MKPKTIRLAGETFAVLKARKPIGLTWDAYFTILAGDDLRIRGGKL